MNGENYDRSRLIVGHSCNSAIFVARLLNLFAPFCKGTRRYRDVRFTDNFMVGEHVLHYSQGVSHCIPFVFKVLCRRSVSFSLLFFVARLFVILHNS